MHATYSQAVLRSWTTYTFQSLHTYVVNRCRSRTHWIQALCEVTIGPLALALALTSVLLVGFRWPRSRDFSNSAGRGLGPATRPQVQVVASRIPGPYRRKYGVSIALDLLLIAVHVRSMSTRTTMYLYGVMVPARISIILCMELISHRHSGCEKRQQCGEA